MRLSLTRLRIGILALFGFLGCDRPATAPEAAAGKREAVSCLTLRIAAPQGDFASVADRATVTVSGPDIGTVSAPLAITDSTLEGELCGLPGGTRLHFQVAVYDSVSTLAFTGEDSVDGDGSGSLAVAIALGRVGTVRLDGVLPGRID